MTDDELDARMDEVFRRLKAAAKHRGTLQEIRALISEGRAITVEMADNMAARGCTDDALAWMRDNEAHFAELETLAVSMNARHEATEGRPFFP